MPDLACPACGSLNASARTFCWKCASDLRAVVPDPTAPPPPPKVEVPIQPLLIGGGVALAVIALIAILVVVLGGAPAATTSPSVAPTTPAITAGATDGGAGTSAGPTAVLVTEAPPTEAPTQAPPATPKVIPIPAPTILSFTGPTTVDCSDQSFDGFITLTWEVAYADSTELSIDYPGVYKSYPGVAGSDRVPFGCGAGEHRYTLTTVGGDGPAAKRTLTITEG